MENKLIDIEPIIHKKNYNIIVEKILDYISKKKLKKGELLPAQKVLSRSIRVNIQSIREAYSILEICGIIKTKAGIGTIINVDEVNFFLKPRVLNNLHKKADLIDCFDLMKLLERQSYILSAKNAHEEDIKNIEKVLDQQVKKYNSNGWYKLETDHKFHLEIAKSTKNRLLKDLFGYLYIISEINRNFWENLIKGNNNEMKNFPDKDIGFNKKIFKLIKERDINAIKKTSDDYYNYLREILVNYF